MYLSHDGGLPWTCERCGYASDDPREYEGQASDGPVMLVVWLAGGPELAVVTALRAVDQDLQGTPTLEMVRAMASDEGWSVGPMPLWRANKVRYAMKGQPLRFAVRHGVA